MNVFFLPALRRFLEGRFDLRIATPQTYRALLIRTGSSALADLATAEFVTDIATLNEYDGAGYARQTLTIDQDPTVDVGNLRVDMGFVDPVFSAIGPASSGAQGIACLVYEFVTSDADSPLLTYFDEGGFPFLGTGTDFTVQNLGIAAKSGVL